jgi:4-amino-4-deoxy-L-arabinose transferase-like glycosyltransferase
MRDRSRAIRNIVVIIVAALALYLAGNGSVSLWDRDEPRYAQTSRQMLQSGDWVVPRLLDQIRTAKPVFIYWCQASSMKIFGDTAFAARLPSVIGMTLTLVLLAVTVYRAVGRRRATFTVLVMATAGLSIAAAKMCLTDAVLLLFVTTAQICLCAMYLRKLHSSLPYSGERRGEGPGGEDEGGRRKAEAPSPLHPSVFIPHPFRPAPHPTSPPSTGQRGLGAAALPSSPLPPFPPSSTVAAMMWIAIGFAGLTKGPVVLGVQATTMLVLLIADWKTIRFRWWKQIHPIAGIVIVTAICAPWLYLIQQRAPEFLRTAVGHDVIERASSGLEGHSGPPGYYLLLIWGTFFPWSLLLPATIVSAWRRRHIPHVRFALAALVGPWIMFELIATKLPHYVLPTFPPLAFLTADMLVCAARKKLFADRVFLRIVIAFAAIVVLISLAPWAALPLFGVPDGIAMIFMILLPLLAIEYGRSVYIHFRAKRPLDAAVGMGAGMMILIAVLYAGYLPHASFLRISPQVAQVLRDQGATRLGDAIMIDYKETSLAFYQGGTIRAKDDNFFDLTPPIEWPRWVVITESAWTSRSESVRAAYEIVRSVHGMNIAGKDSAKRHFVNVLILRRTSTGAR